MTWVLIVVAVILVMLGTLVRLLRSRAAHLWLPGYLSRRRVLRRLKPKPPVHVFFLMVDHFEPGVGGADGETRRRRVRAYTEHLAEAVGDFRDADGRPPVQTMFYPVEEYEPELLAALEPLAAKRLVEVEVHLHHDNDTAENLRRTLDRAKELYRSHGFLSRMRDQDGIRFGFIHGNWALDNSRPDGRWCGVNNELTVLRECGCYADFTFPSAPSPTQPRTVNSIYYATDDPRLPRSHDFGTPVRVGGRAQGDLLIIQGPLCPNWSRRKMGLLPRLENAEIAENNPPTPERVDLWVRQHVHVQGRPEWVFVKVHAHGAREDSARVLLGESRRRLHEDLERRYNDGTRYVLHYVSAREAYNLVKAAEAGRTGNPNEYRDFVLVPLRQS